MTIDFRFTIGQRVYIIDLDRQLSTIQSLHVGTKGVTYEVFWFHDGDRKSGFLFESELEEKK